jgi:pimeloyl-ACP methyl ester carboxylesterase
MHIEARGFTFDVVTAGGDGEPAVLLLHGFPQNATEWAAVTPVLDAAGLRTIAPDQRGYSPGARPADAAAYSLAECTADALALLDAFGVEKAHVVGHDWGALVAWHLAGHHPDRVETLTAISVAHPTAMADAIAGDPDQQQRSSYIQLFRRAGHAEDLLLADGGARLRAMFAGCPTHLIDSYVDPMLDRAALTGALNWYRAMSNDSLRCPESTVPTTFVWGEGDPAIGAKAAYDCAKYVRADYKFVPLSGVGHWIPDEVPAATAEAILARVEG